MRRYYGFLLSSDGSAEAHPTESTAAKLIYSEYLNDLSLGRIAESLSSSSAIRLPQLSQKPFSQGEPGVIYIGVIDISENHSLRCPAKIHCHEVFCFRWVHSTVLLLPVAMSAWSKKAVCDALISFCERAGSLHRPWHRRAGVFAIA